MLDELVSIAVEKGKSELFCCIIGRLTDATQRGLTLRQFALELIDHHAEILYGTRTEVTHGT